MNNPILIPIACLLICGSSNAYAQAPGGVSANLKLWVKAESAQPTAGGNLTSWPDQTGTNTFTRSGTASTLTTVNYMINFHPIVRFTGSAILIGNTSIAWSECTAVASWTGPTNTERGTVISPTTNGTQPLDQSRYFFRSGVESNPSNALFAGMGVDSIGFEYTTAPPASQVNIYTASGVGDVFNRNGLDARTGSLFGGFTKRATVMNGIPQIGDRSTSDSKMKGDIAEIIVYSSNNAAGRNKVESYLALKYGLTLGSIAQPVNYTSSTGTVFWTGNTTYQHNLFGIGADAGSALNQTQSNSMNTGSGLGAGQSGMGNIVISAIGSLTSQQFLMIGTDSAALLGANNGEESITAAIGPSVAIGSKRLVRTWKVANTNSAGSVKLTFNTSGLTLSGGTTASNYYLVIDNDGDGNFTTGTQSYWQANSLASNLMTFNAVPLNNNVVFTILTKPSSMNVLTVSWQDFTAGIQRNTVNLQWTVANETNIDQYVVERSSNAADFIRVGSLPAQNPTGVSSYTFSDQPVAGNYFYRIRMIDKDGNYQFSALRSVTTGGKTLLQIRANPVQGSILQLAIDLPRNGTVKISIVDGQRALLLQKELSLQQGGNMVAIDLATLAKGLYFVRLQTDREQRTLSFLK